MATLSRYANRPYAFLLRYIKLRPASHAGILAAVLGAVGASVSTQYGVKFLVDAMAQGPGGNKVWTAFILLISLIVADNLLWRVAGWIGSYAFVGVIADLRRDLFRHLTGHAPSYFAERLPGTLTGRITATSNAVYTIENMFTWNILPPLVATIAAIVYLALVSVPMAAGLTAFAAVLVVILFRLASNGGPLHRGFAEKAAAVEGEMVDVIGNMPLVWAFGGISREHRRFDEMVDRETAARTRSLLYIERLRFLHAAVTAIVTIGLIAWGIKLWQQGAATSGDVILVCTLGCAILHATRDLAVALVDGTQHMARLSEAIATLLVPHDLRDHPNAVPLTKRRESVVFDNVSFSYPDGRRVFENFNLSLRAGERTGLVGPSGGGKSTLLALLQRFHDVQGGRILVDGQDISQVTQRSLREAIAVVPQDISLLHRSVMENIRYGRPEATDEEVMEAAEAARCRGFIEALPYGAQTIVGDRGVKLSGGQRQRIAIARALLKNAPILLLDEATSALDTESEEAIRAALDRLMEGRTVIAIAHRLSTLRNFDRIVFLRAGRIIQDGAPSELLEGDGPYRALVEREMTRLSLSSKAA